MGTFLVVIGARASVSRTARGSDDAGHGYPRRRPRVRIGARWYRPAMRRSGNR
jgi:hypothetical protein